MKIPFLGFSLLLIYQISQGNIPIAFYGMSTKSAPQVGNEFEQIIKSRILNLKKGDLIADETIEQFKFEERINPEDVKPGIGPQVCKALGCRVLVTGNLHQMDMTYKRGWWPNRGEAELSYSMDLLIMDGSNGNVLYNGSLKSKQIVEDVYLPEIPKVTHIDAVTRQESRVDLLNQLGDELEYKLAVLLDRLELNIQVEQEELKSKSKKKGSFSFSAFNKKKKKKNSKSWLKKSKRKKGGKKKGGFGFGKKGKEKKKKKFSIKTKKDSEEDEGEDEDKKKKKKKKKFGLKKKKAKDKKADEEKEEVSEEDEKPKKKKKKKRKFGFKRKKSGDI